MSNVRVTKAGHTLDESVAQGHTIWNTYITHRFPCSTFMQVQCSEMTETPRERKHRTARTASMDM